MLTFVRQPTLNIRISDEQEFSDLQEAHNYAGSHNDVM